MFDLRHALRGLLRTPGFSLGVLGLLAAALGLALSIGSAVSTLLLRPLPYPEGERLVEVSGVASALGASLGWSPGLLDDLRTLPEVEAVGPYALRPPLHGADGAEYAQAALSPDALALLGARPLLGALFAADTAAVDDVLLAETTWRTRFAADPEIIGRVLDFEGRRLRVAGVLPAAFRFPHAQIALWTPLRYSADELAAADRFELNGAPVLARLAPGVTPARLTERLQATLGVLPALASLREHMQLRLQAVALRERWIGERRELVVLLGAAAAAVLLLLVANLVALWLARCVQRAHELALRSALGADARRLGRLLGGELLLLCSAAMLLGIALVDPGLGVLQWLGVIDAGLPWQVGIDAGTFVQALLVTALLMLGLAGAARAMARRSVPLGSLAHAATGVGGGARPRRLQRGLVAAQLALAIALLGAGTLLTRSLWDLINEDPGFQPDGVTVAVLDGDPDAAPDATAALLRDVAAQPGIDAVSFTSAAPFSAIDTVSLIRIRGGDGTQLPVRERSVGRDYLRVMQQPLLRGRDFAPAAADGRSGVLIDERFARLHLAGRDPLQAELDFSGEGDWQPVLGVVATARHVALDEQPEHGTVLQLAAAPYAAGDFLVLRTALPPAAIAPRLRELARMHGLRVRDVATLEQRMRATVADRMHLLVLVVVFAGCGTVLAALGLFALAAFMTQQRRAEFAVRLALGASRRSLAWLAVRAGMHAAWPGVLIGLLAALALGRLLAAQLHRIGPYDMPSLLLVAAIAMLVTLAACWLPARRAARIDPLVTLRHE